MRFPTDQEMKTFQRLWQRLWLAIALGRALFGLVDKAYNLAETAMLVTAFVGFILLADWLLLKAFNPLIDILADKSVPWLVRALFYVVVQAPLAMINPLAVLPSLATLTTGIAKKVGETIAKDHLVTKGEEPTHADNQLIKPSSKPVAFAQKHGAYRLHPLTQSLLIY